MTIGYKPTATVVAPALQPVAGARDVAVVVSVPQARCLHTIRLSRSLERKWSKDRPRVVHSSW
jgi:hypothetical protein